MLLFVQIVVFSYLLSKSEKFKMLRTGLSHDGRTEKMALKRIFGPKREKQEADDIIYSYFLPNIIRMMKYLIYPNIRPLCMMFYYIFIVYSVCNMSVLHCVGRIVKVN